MHNSKYKKHIKRSAYTLSLLLLLTTVYYFIIGFSLNNPGYSFNKRNNAIWIGHKWISEEHSDKEIMKLVKDFQDHDINTVFVHSGPLLENGSVDTSIHKFTRDFVESAKSFNKDIQYQAWLGQIRGKIDLSSKTVRNNISSVSLLLTNSIGFDGIHFDIEPIHDNDTDFLLLLLETKNKIGTDKKMSVAISELIPKSVIWFLDDVHKFEYYNSEKNFRNISEIADQIVVMIYDTGISKQWLYTWLVKEQTIRMTKLITGDKDLFIAIPTYDYTNHGFNPEVENIETGLNGIINGLNDLRSDSNNFTGVALYPYWEIDALEWNSYEKIFQNK